MGCHTFACGARRAGFCDFTACFYALGAEQMVSLVTLERSRLVAPLGVRKDVPN